MQLLNPCRTHRGFLDDCGSLGLDSQSFLASEIMSACGQASEYSFPVLKSLIEFSDDCGSLGADS